MALSDAHEKAFEEAKQAASEGNYQRAQEIINSLSNEEVDDLLGLTEETAADLADGNPDEELAEAIQELEPAAGEVAKAALEAGRPDLAEEVVMTTLSALADMAEAEQEIAETIEEVAAEIDDPQAQEIASEAADAADVAAEAVTETLEESGIPPAVAEAEVDPANGTETYVEDIPPQPSHWLFRKRLGGRV